MHQFVRIGAHCMTSGGSKVGQDIPPFMIAQGYPARLRGINKVGLQRRGFSDETIRLLAKAYRALFMSEEPRFDDAMAKVREAFSASKEVVGLLDFIDVALKSDRGFMRPAT